MLVHHCIVIWTCLCLAGTGGEFIHHCYYSHTTDQAEWLTRNTIQLSCSSSNDPSSSSSFTPSSLSSHSRGVLVIRRATLGFTSPLLVVGSGAVQQACPSLSLPACELNLHTVAMTCSGKRRCQLFHQPLPLLMDCRNALIAGAGGGGGSSSRPVVSFLHVEYSCIEFDMPRLNIHRCVNEDEATLVACTDNLRPVIEAAYIGYSPRVTNNCPPTIYQCTAELDNSILGQYCSNQTRTCHIPAGVTSLPLPAQDPRWPMCTEAFTTNFVHVQYVCVEDPPGLLPTTTTSTTTTTITTPLSTTRTRETTSTASTTTSPPQPPPPASAPATAKTTTAKTTITGTISSTTTGSIIIPTPARKTSDKTSSAMDLTNQTNNGNDTNSHRTDGNTSSSIGGLNSTVLDLSVNMTALFNGSLHADGDVHSSFGSNIKAGAIVGIVLAVLLSLGLLLLLLLLLRKGKIKLPCLTKSKNIATKEDEAGFDGPAVEYAPSPHIYDVVASTEHIATSENTNDLPAPSNPQTQYSQIKKKGTTQNNGFPSEKTQSAREKPQIPVKPIFSTEEATGSRKPEAQIGVVQPNCHLTPAISGTESTEYLNTLYEDIEKYCRNGNEVQQIEIGDHTYDEVANYGKTVSQRPQSEHRVSYLEILQPESDAGGRGGGPKGNQIEDICTEGEDERYGELEESEYDTIPADDDDDDTYFRTIIEGRNSMIRDDNNANSDVAEIASDDDDSFTYYDDTTVTTNGAYVMTNGDSFINECSDVRSYDNAVMTNYDASDDDGDNVTTGNVAKYGDTITNGKNATNDGDNVLADDMTNGDNVTGHNVTADDDKLMYECHDVVDEYASYPISLGNESDSLYDEISI